MPLRGYAKGVRAYKVFLSGSFFRPFHSRKLLVSFCNSFASLQPWETASKRYISVVVSARLS